MAREVSSRNALRTTLCGKSRRNIILKIGCITYPNTPEGRKAYRETLPAERSKPRIPTPITYSKVWHEDEYEKNGCIIKIKTNTE